MISSEALTGFFFFSLQTTKRGDPQELRNIFLQVMASVLCFFLVELGWGEGVSLVLFRP